ncbi:MAG TPA: glycosyltransferase [Bryobacteraceae bacterium]|nr:glycosyltransferase [Bryobacteraceae bacterium]
MPPRIAVLIPCLNEELSIATVVRDFIRALPGAVVYVYDNNSSDRSGVVAAEAGAVVRHEPRQGKGFNVRRMFRDVDADIYILVDGDDTYDPGAAIGMAEVLIREQLDMVIARRVGQDEAYRAGHRTGNALFTRAISALFGRRVTDVLSGYRAFSRRFVKSFVGVTGGFEIETEITVHALTLGLPFREVDAPYRNRGAGSESKLNTWGDGFRILLNILRLVREERPILYFSAIGSLLIGVAMGLGYPIVLEFHRTGLVPRFPTAILATGLVLSGLLSVACGLVLDSVARTRREAKYLAYLNATSEAV